MRRPRPDRRRRCRSELRDGRLADSGPDGLRARPVLVLLRAIIVEDDLVGEELSLSVEDDRMAQASVQLPVHDDAEGSRPRISRQPRFGVGGGLGALDDATATDGIGRAGAGRRLSPAGAVMAEIAAVGLDLAKTGPRLHGAGASPLPLQGNRTASVFGRRHSGAWSGTCQSSRADVSRRPTSAVATGAAAARAAP
jgi:hypothetical protein